MAGDQSPEVRFRVTRNSRTPPSAALILLAADSRNSVRNYVVLHPNAPLDVVEGLADDPEDFIRGNVERRLAAGTDWEWLPYWYERDWQNS